MNTPLSEIPNLPDNTVLPILTGTIDRIFDVKEGVNKKGKNWKKQSWVIRAPSGTVLVETFTQSLFITESDVGNEITWFATETSEGFKGIVKTSYKSNEGENKTKIELHPGTKLKAPKPMVPKPTPQILETPPHVPASMQRSYSSDIEKLAKQWRCCFLAAKEHVPEIQGEHVQGLATTLFIEGQRKGLKFSSSVEPRVHVEQVEAKAPTPAQVEPEKPKTEEPVIHKRSDESLATKVFIGDHVTREELAGMNLEGIFDLLYSEAKAEVDVIHLDAEYDAAKERSKGDEALTLQRIIVNWSKFLASAKARSFVEPEFEVE